MPSLCVLSWLVSIAQLAAGPSPSRISFSDLGPNDRIEVDYLSRGCFHSLRHLLVFRRDVQLEVTVMRPEPQSGVDASGYLIRYYSDQLTDPKPTRLVGKLALSSGQENRLDALLNFYR